MMRRGEVGHYAGLSFSEESKPGSNMPQWKKNIWIPLGILVGGLLVAVLLYLIAVLPATEKMHVYKSYGENGGFPSAIMENTQALQQDISVEAGPWSGFGFYLGTYQADVEGFSISGSVINTETQEVVALFSKELSKVQDNALIEVPFTQGEELAAGSYTIKALLACKENKPISVWLTSENGLAGAVINNIAQEGSIWLELFAKSTYLTSYYWWVALPLVLLLVFLWYVTVSFQWKWKNIFLVAALGLGVLYIFVYPSYSMLDDDVHIPATFYFSSRLLYGETLENGSFENRAEDDMRGYVRTSPGRAQLYHTYEGLFEKEKNPEETYSLQASVFGQPYQYYPQMLGVSLARLMGWGQVSTLILGRLFALVVYVGITYFIIHICPLAFKPLFTMLGIIPFALHVAGSFSYDTSIFALSFLFISYVLHISYDKERMRIVDIVFLAVIAVLLAPLKYVYIPVLLTVFLIPKQKWPRPWAKLVFGALLMAGGVVVLFYVARMQAGLYAGAIPAMVGVTPWDDPEGGYTYAALFQQPLEMIRLVFFSAFGRLEEMILGMGYYQFNSLPTWLCFTAWVLVFISGVPVKGESPLAFSAWQKGLFGISAASVYLMVIAVALPWTYIGAYYVRGLQGRYFIAIFPLVALLMRGFLQRRRNNDRALLYGMVLINAYGIISLLLSAMNNRQPTRV